MQRNTLVCTDKTSNILAIVDDYNDAQRHFENIETKLLVAQCEKWITFTAMDLGASKVENIGYLIARRAQFLVEKHPRMTFSDLKRAFTMAINHEFDLSFGDYVRMSIRLVSNVLNQYSKYRFRKVKTVIELQPDPPKTKEEIHEIYCEYLDRMNDRFVAYCQNDTDAMSEVFCNKLAHRWLKKFGLVRMDLNALRIAYEKSTENIIVAGQRKAAQAMHHTVRTQIRLEHSQTTREYWIAEIVRVTFQTMKHQVVNLKQIIEQHGYSSRN